MRRLAKLDDEKKGYALAQFLEREGIKIDVSKQVDLAGKPTIEIWVESEDDMEMASHWHQEFEKSPEDMRFQVTPKEVVTSNEDTNTSDAPLKGPTRVPPPFQPKRRKVTSLFLGLCVFIFCFNLFTTWGKKEPAYQLELTPTYLALIYDVPARLEKLVQFYDKYKINSYEKLNHLNKEEQAAFDKVVATPSWSGIYDYFVDSKHAKQNLSAPMFVKIRQGQFYRVITPCFMHAGVIHILFNMLWLLLLGPAIERRIKLYKYILLTLILGLVSNTAQYLVSGPLFVGYSGIICGLAGFIFSRQRVAPWEGYPLPKSTFIFLSVYVLVLLVMSVLSLFLAKFSITQVPINIANTAHITGGVVGLILGRLPFFSKEVV